MDVYSGLMSLLALCSLGYFWWMLASFEPFCYIFTYTQRRFYKVHRNTGVKFDDIIGLEDVKEEVKKEVARTSKGFYFVGPPGTGKTMIAKAIATEINLPFIEVFINDISSGNIPTVLKTISKNYKKAIILMDECDPIIGRFDNALLRQLDGMDSFNNIIFILTSNKDAPKNITRSGRIDRIIRFNLPSYKDRIEILNRLSFENVEKIAKMTDGFCHADLIKLKSECDNEKPLGSEDIANIINRITNGMETCKANIPENERSRLIYHEIGHCLISYAVDEKNKPNSVSIKSTGEMLGQTKFDVTDHLVFTKSDLLKRIATLLASSVFEQYYLEEHSTLCSVDFTQINEIMKMMDNNNMLKNLYPSKEEKRSEKTHILEIIRGQILQFIEKNQSLIDKMYSELSVKETLDQVSISSIIEGNIAYTFENFIY